ncbi:MAG: Glucosamine-6-phosphate isomerase/6-phosphogluconolactonase [Candidatus Parcubacteria bacterium]|jgi:6-phosphogluconolactonase/glucosamine-6-phosphate isomerase/deaminase
MKIIQSERPEIEAANLIEDKLQAYINQPILLLLSGGSWLSVYEEIRAIDLDDRVTIGMLDERFSEDVTVNNFAQFMQTHIYEEALKRGVRFIDTRLQAAETLNDLAKRFTESLQAWRTQNSDGIIIATLGLGTDGHTAGIFSTLDTTSFPENTWAVGYEVDKSVNEYAQRVTVTPYFLTHEVEQAICYVVGENKCEVLGQIISEDKQTKKYPAQIWQEMKEVAVVTNCKM